MVIGVRITYLDPERNAKCGSLKFYLSTSVTILPSKSQKLFGVFAFSCTIGLLSLCSCKNTNYFVRLTGFPGNDDRSKNNIPGSRKKCQMRLIKVLPIHFCNHIAIKKAETLWSLCLFECNRVTEFMQL